MALFAAILLRSMAETAALTKEQFLNARGAMTETSKRFEALAVQDVDMILDYFPRFPPAPCRPKQSVRSATLSNNAHQMLIGACNPMVCPIHVFRSVCWTSAKSMTAT